MNFFRNILIVVLAIIAQSFAVKFFFVLKNKLNNYIYITSVVPKVQYFVDGFYLQPKLWKCNASARQWKFHRTFDILVFPQNSKLWSKVELHDSHWNHNPEQYNQTLWCKRNEENDGFNWQSFWKPNKKFRGRKYIQSF